MFFVLNNKTSINGTKGKAMPNICVPLNAPRKNSEILIPGRQSVSYVAS